MFIKIKHPKLEGDKVATVAEASFPYWEKKGWERVKDDAATTSSTPTATENTDVTDANAQDGQKVDPAEAATASGTADSSDPSATRGGRNRG